MKGSKEPRGKSWLLRVYLGRDAKGKPIRKNKTIPPGPDGKRIGSREADRELKNFIDSLSGVRNADFAKMLFGAYLDWWVENVQESNCEGSTIEWQKGIIATKVKPALGHFRMDRLSTANIQTFYRDQLDHGNRKTGKGLSLRTVSGYAKILNAALNYAKGNLKCIPENPAESAKLDTPGKRKYQTLDSEAVLKFIDEAKRDRLFALWIFFLFTGLRKSEALALQWQDVNLEAGIGEVRQTVVRYGKNYAFKPRAKNETSLREFPIPDILCEVLRAHKSRQNEERLRAGPIWQENDLVFCYEDGRPVNGHSILRRHEKKGRFELDRSRQGCTFRTILARAKLPLETRIHDLRHSFATLLMEEGVNQSLIGAMLGHADGSMITDLYTHSNIRMKRRAADRLARKYIPKDLVRSK